MTTKFLVAIILLSTLFSCKTTAPVTNLSPNPNRSTQASIKGNWQVTGVSFPGSNYFKVTSFQLADSKCFTGSKWNFIPNNNKGSMTLTSSECPPLSSPIVWSLDKEGNFGLKFVGEGVKAKAVTQGYLLKIVNQTDNSFQLVDKVNVSGQTKEIIYQFEKIQ